VHPSKFRQPTHRFDILSIFDQQIVSPQTSKQRFLQYIQPLNQDYRRSFYRLIPDSTMSLPRSERTIPASFPLFGALPRELRVQIWTDALPGSRIIYVERHLFNKEKDEKGNDERKEETQEPTYFTSPSPNKSVTTLLDTCKESRAVVMKHYSRIFPYSSTWFSFAEDFLYLDWGWRYFSTPYSPAHFTPSYPQDPISRWYGHPVCDKKMASQVRNLVLCTRHRQFPARTSYERWLVTEVLSVFTGTKVLVMGNQFHGRFESREELVWLGDEVSVELVEGRTQHPTRNIYTQWPFNCSILWRDRGEYAKCLPLVDSYHMKEWQQSINRHEMPKIFKKSITTAALKRSLLEICGADNIGWATMNLDWDFVTGIRWYEGGLSLSQQIAFLRLVLARIETNYSMDCQGCVRGQLYGDILPMIKRIEEMEAEQEGLELIIAEAEQMNWAD
jgi:hypothetical protein